MKQRVLYFDNAATSWPKPPEVAEAITRFLQDGAASPGRSLHRLSIQASSHIDTLRMILAERVNAECPERLILTYGATDSLTMAVKGVLMEQIDEHLTRRAKRPHVVATRLEHNAVRRPINQLEARGQIDVTWVDCDKEGFVRVDDVLNATREETELIACMHASNALGTIQPVAQIGAKLRERCSNALLLVDAAQTMGALPIDVQAMNIDLLAFTAHKSMLGPTGLGGLYVGERVCDQACSSPKIRNIRQGGTGADSTSPLNPRSLPAYFEAGTPNMIGIVGLLAALEHSPKNALKHERTIVARLIEHLSEKEGVQIVGPRDVSQRTAALSLIFDRFSPQEAAGMLDSSFNIATRPGLHCAPGAHEAMGLAPDGALRISPGPYTTDDEVDQVINALDQILAQQTVSAL